ncbi:MAG: hypothetical protein IJW13_03520 [Clostridia bacterium]|nr:hypothetical protein [Clostridia bacterium]
MTNRSKIETFIGFSIKARALITGTNSIGTLKKAYLVLLCDTASDNAKKIAQSYSNKFGCPLMICKIPLEQLTGKENCKMAAITDVNLAKAVLDNQDGNFSVSSGGNGL